MFWHSPLQGIPVLCLRTQCFDALFLQPVLRWWKTLLLQWDPIDLTAPDELYPLLLCHNPDKVHLRGFSCLGIRSEISPQRLHFIFTSSQQPGPITLGSYKRNAWSQSSLWCWISISDGAKDKLWAEQLSCGETDHRGASNSGIWVTKSWKCA